MLKYLKLIKKHIYPISIVLIMLLLAGYLQHYAPKQEVQQPKAVQGVLDLRNWDFERLGALSLEGEWEFYWEKLLNPQELAKYQEEDLNPIEMLSGGYLSVPGLWNGREIEREGEALKPSGQGYATYRLTVLTKTADQILGLKLLDFATSYRLWVNKKLAAANGQVGKTPAETVPQAFPLLVTFAQPTEQIEIVLQVANFSHQKGGIRTDIRLGTIAQIQKLREQAVTKNYFFTGGLLLMAVYHLGLFLLRRKEPSSFFCSMLCLLIAIRVATTGETFLLNIWPTLNWSTLYRLQYLSYYLAVPVFIQFIYLLFPQETKRFLVKAAWLMAGLFSLPVLFGPAYVYSKYSIWYELYTILVLLYVLIIILGLALHRRREGAGFFLLGTAAIIITAVNDILVAYDVLYGPYIVDTGLFIFTFCQTMVFAARFSRSFATVEELSDELQEAMGQLESVNRTLEDKVQKRTRKLEQATIAANAANQAKSDFLAMISHEIRTPLHGLLGMTELLQESHLQEGKEVYTAAIKNSGEMLLEIISDLLDYTRMEEGKLALENKAFPLLSTLQDVVELTENRAKAKGLEFCFLADPGLPEMIMGDPLRFKQVLLNLLGNAIKFTPQGRVVLKAGLKMTLAAHPWLYCEVGDTGIGISESARSQLFKPFSQVDPTKIREFGGTGLGLSIAKRLAEMMGGEIDYQSEVGQGSLFWLALPLKAVGTESLSKEAGGGYQDVTPSSIKPFRCQNAPVLVVEDYALNRTLLLGQLERLGLKGEAVLNAQEALEAIKKNNYALILMDCRMPGLDGYDLARAIRQQERSGGGHIPIIACTASTAPGERERIAAAGMDDALVKPVRLRELYQALLRWLPGAEPDTIREEGTVVQSGQRESEPAEMPPLDFADPERQEEIWHLADGNKDFLITLLETFLQDMPRKQACLAEALQRGEAKTVELQAHGMKSSANLLGFTRLAGLCLELEQEAGQERLAEARELLVLMEKEYRRAENELKAYLARL